MKSQFIHARQFEKYIFYYSFIVCVSCRVGLYTLRHTIKLARYNDKKRKKNPNNLLNEVQISDIFVQIPNPSLQKKPSTK